MSYRQRRRNMLFEAAYEGKQPYNMTYTTLRESRVRILRKEEFTGNNVYGRWHTAGPADDPGEDHMWYVVYSYGTHFPMYIFDQDTEQWYGNSDRYSSTTSRHQSTCRPPDVHHWHDTGTMQKFAMWGVVPVIRARIAPSPWTDVAHATMEAIYAT